MKGSAITGPVGKEAAELWPVSISPGVWGEIQTDESSVLLPTPVSLCKSGKVEK